MKTLKEALISKNKRDWATSHKISFDKKDLVFGTLVMFKDQTAGIYIPEDKYDLVKNEFSHINDDEGIFMCHELRDSNPVYQGLRDFDDELNYQNSKEDKYSVCRVYYDKVPEKEIKRIISHPMYNKEMFSLLSKKKYIERK